VRAFSCIAVSLALAALAAWPGVGRQGAFFLLLLAVVTLMMSHRVPDFAAGLALVAAWLLLGVATPAEALSGFASKEWLFVVSIYGLAAATASSGVLFRVGLLLARRLPAGLLAQSATLLLTGLALTPLVPSSTGRAALTSPLALAVAEALRLPERGRASALLGLGAWVGAGPLMFMFLNGSGTCLLAWGLLPEASRLHFTWINWLVAAAPLGVFVSLGALGLLFLLFRPEGVAAPSHERISLQVAILGRPAARELATIAILILTVAGWIASPWLGLDLSLIALLGLLATVAARSLDLRAFQTLDWNFLVFFGVVLTIGRLATSQGLDRAAGGAITALLGAAEPGPLLFVVAVGLLSAVLRLVVDQQLAVLLGSMTLIPVAPRLGLDPWVVVVALLATSVAWFLPSQTPSYLVAQSASEGRLFSHAQARRFAVAYAGLTLAGLALSIPYWRFLRLVKQP
jgi:di/tricarboxylate transporter